MKLLKVLLLVFLFCSPMIPVLFTAYREYKKTRDLQASNKKKLADFHALAEKCMREHQDSL